MIRVTHLVTAMLLALTVHVAPSRTQAAPPAKEAAFFESKIRPALVKYCFECHAADSKEIGGKLLLDSREGLLKGGETGPAVVARQPDKSLIIQALRYDGLEMPPKEKLPDAVVNDFVIWVKNGAFDPRRPKDKPETKKTETDAANKSDDSEKLWSLKPVQTPAIPETQNAQWPRDAIDRFVLAKIEAAGLAPQGDASARTLIRRLYYDLIGLPPTREQVESFVSEWGPETSGAKTTSESETQRTKQTELLTSLVDRLLASPQFGERWGRMWLDVARFGESNGNDGLGRNPSFPHAWRFRDYVISAFNEDVPFDRFLTEQIAGDLLPSESDAQRDRYLIATGFLALGSKPAKAMNTNFEMDIVADQIDVIGRGVMGLSVACARCHDHKFDPVPTRDYYALAGFFTSTETMWGTAAHEGLTAPATDLHVLKATANVPPPKGWVETVLVLDSNTGKPRPFPKSKWAIGTPLAMGVRDRDKPADAKINVKGEASKLGEQVPRGFLSACDFSHDIKVDTAKSGRLQLAEWLTHPEHPLTSRVIVNRLWQQLFGEGLVRTPDDFGVYGERPTHPELLDHLARRFVQGGWSIKQLVRAIVLTRTYQLSSEVDSKLLQADGENLLHARHNRRRLEAEALRDSMLQVSGQLDENPGDGSLMRHRDILVNLAGNLHQPSRQRSVYLCYLRSAPPPELAAFDLPDFTSVTGKRDVSTVTSQALYLFNSPFVIEQAELFARSVMTETADPFGRAKAAWRRTYLREPTEKELEQAVELVRATAADLGSEAISDEEKDAKACASLCQALLVTNEFRYVD